MGNQLTILRDALLAIPTVASVTRGQPDCEAALPCVAYSLEERREQAAFDDAAYLRCSVYRLRLFAREMDTLDALTDEIDDALQGLGFRCTLTADSPEDAIKQKTMRYEMMD